MKRNSVKHAYLTLGLLLSVVVIGTIGYSLLGFTPSEAVYQTIITIATVGFEEVHQLDNRGMWFTSFLVIVSIGVFFYAVTSFTRYIVEGVFMNTYKDTKVKRKIEKISDHVVICPCSPAKPRCRAAVHRDLLRQLHCWDEWVRMRKDDVCLGMS